VERPNILVIVLDCVRASDFPGGADTVPGMTHVERLRRESWEFRKASSVAHWTVPAHASLFTGLYPWQHGVHAKGRLALDSSSPQLAQRLQGAGYRTLSLSANGLISPTLGLTSGSDQAAWGVSLFNRFGEGEQPPQGSGGPARTAAVAENLVRERMKELSVWAGVYLARYPGFWDLSTKVVHRVRHPEVQLPPRLAPWLEPTLGRWLQEVPASQPAYCFINLLDAHEPYLSSSSPEDPESSWWKYQRTRQDRRGWVSGDWNPAAKEFSRLHRLYRESLGLLDRRIGRIIQAFEDAGRWENTLVVLTSDHGQAFGEHGALFHINGIDEPELRVPLLVRPPGGRNGTGSSVGWASLIDIAPTCLRMAGLDDEAASLPGCDLRSLFEAPRPTPVFSMNDGLVHASDAVRAPSARRDQLDRLLVGAYVDDQKVILDPVSGQVRAFNVERDPGEAHDLWESQQADFASLSDLAAEIGRQLVGGPQRPLESDVEDRLQSWGYI